MQNHNDQTRHVCIPVCTKSLVASLILSMIVGAFLLAFDYYDLPIPTTLGVVTGVVLSWLTFEIFIRTKYKSHASE